MTLFRSFILFSLVIFTLFACKKKDSIPVPVYEANLAPCEISEELVVIDSIIYGPSADFPQAYLRITLMNSALEFAFNKVPETGMYHMVPNFSSGYPYDNQMATVEDSGSFRVFSGVTELPEVYIENYNNELIISYCSLQNGGIFYFDQLQYVYIGNRSGSRKVRMSY